MDSSVQNRRIWILDSHSYSGSVLPRTIPEFATIVHFLLHLPQFSKGNEDQCNVDEPPIATLPNGDNCPPFIRPRSPDIHNSMSNPTSTDLLPHTQLNVSVDPNVPPSSTPSLCRSAQQPDDRGSVMLSSLKWISSTPAPHEHNVRQVLFGDSPNKSMLNLDATVSLPRLTSPEAVTSSRLIEPVAIDLTLSDSECCDENAVTTPPSSRSRKLEGLGKGKRHCRTPIPRRRNLHMRPNDMRLFSKSMSAVTDRKPDICIDDACVHVNSTAGNIRLPKDSTNALPGNVTPPLTSSAVASPVPEQRPIHLVWEALFEATQLLPNSQLNSHDGASARLSSTVPLGQLMERSLLADVSASAPCVSPVKSASKLPLRSYASYRMKASRPNALMSNSRLRTRDDPVQIWSSVNQDPLADEVVWDDSELVAHYDRVDAFVKKKLNALYAAQKEAAKPVEPRPRSTINLRRSGSTHESSPLKRRNTDRSDRRRLPLHGQVLQRERPVYAVPVSNASHSLEAALHSERPEPVLKCDFQWIPPTLYPPDDLFRKRPTPRPQRSRSLNRPTRSVEVIDPPIRMPPLPDSMNHMETLLRSWYEAGYNLGREHGLKVRW
ncbi:unnamed protein product [Echinostoma caproni]|uniref:PHD-type domain-containing protein n=1 Tax=Echinostoma caproni TaxID=27848 RepID=A0A183AET0_9TREM|nr:unnamed protein product [Echinostoma caproni]